MFDFIMDFILDCIIGPMLDYFAVYRDPIDPQRGVINWVTAILLGLGGLFCLTVTVFCVALKWWLLAIPAGAGCIWCTVKEGKHFSECLRERH